MKKGFLLFFVLMLGTFCFGLVGCVNLSARYSLDHVLASFSDISGVNFEIKLSAYVSGQMRQEETVQYIVLENDGNVEMYAKSSVRSESYYYVGEKLYTVSDNKIVDYNPHVNADEINEIFGTDGHQMDSFLEMRTLLNRLKYNVSMEKLTKNITEYHITINKKSFATFYEETFGDDTGLVEYINRISIILRVDTLFNRIKSMQFFIQGENMQAQAFTVSSMLSVIAYDNVSIDYPQSILLAIELKPLDNITSAMCLVETLPFYFSRNTVVGDLLLCLGSVSGAMADTIYVYNLKTSEIVYEEYVGYDYYGSIDSDGEKMIVSNRDILMVYDLSNMRKIHTFEVENVDLYSMEKRIVQVVIEGDRILFGCDYQVIQYTWRNATISYDMESGAISEVSNKSVLIGREVRKHNGKIYYQTTWEDGIQSNCYFDIETLEEGYDSIEVINQLSDAAYGLIGLDAVDRYTKELVNELSNALDFYGKFDLPALYYELVYVNENYCLFAGGFRTIVYSFDEGFIGYIDFNAKQAKKISDGTYVLLGEHNLGLIYLNLND